MTHARGIVELRERRERRDYSVSLFMIGMFAGFILGMFVAVLIVKGEEDRRYETIPTFPREESWHYEQT